MSKLVSLPGCRVTTERRFDGIWAALRLNRSSFLMALLRRPYR
jgi:hypothetical protein